MGAPITKLRTIAGQPQTAFSSNNGLWARSLLPAGGWTKMRIGFRLHMTDSGLALPGTPTFFLGMCAGTSNCYGDASATHAVGIVSYSLGGNGGGRGATYYFANIVNPSKQVGNVVTDGIDMTIDNAHKWTVGNQAGAAASDVGMILIDIKKVNPNWQFQAFWNFSATPAQIDLPTFLLQMQTDPPNPTTNYVSSTVQTLAVNEALNGTLDSVQTYFNPTAVNMEVCTVALCRLQ